MTQMPTLNRARRFALAALFAGTLLGQAHADALVSPIRSLLQTPGETVTVTLRNPSDGPRTYRLGWVEYTQTVAGVGGPIQSGAPVPHPVASPHLRLTPRQITVPPNSNQTVRVQFRPDGTLAPGEYRSHLLFEVIPELSTPVGRQTMGGGADGITLQVDMQMSVAVPIVVRHQTTTIPQVGIAKIEPRIDPNGQAPSLMVTLNQQGPTSAYGRVIVDLQQSASQDVIRIGAADGVSIFPDVGRREIPIPLDPRYPIRSGSLLRVSFEGTAEYAGRVWDSQILQVQ